MAEPFCQLFAGGCVRTVFVLTNLDHA
jgi:hypothetical protein